MRDTLPQFVGDHNSSWATYIINKTLLGGFGDWHDIDSP
jgi:hypothetical protein